MAPTGSGKRLSFEGLPPRLLRQSLAFPFMGIALVGSGMAVVVGLDRFARDMQLGSVSILSFGYLVLWLTGAFSSVVMARMFSALALLAAAHKGRLRGLPYDHTYVLYLRSFTEDHRLFAVDRVWGRGLGPVLGYLAGLTAGYDEASNVWEERVIQYFRRLGHVVGVADPDSTQLNPGVYRFRLPEDVPGQEWHPAVSEAIRNARLVIIVAGIGGDGETAAGTLWEYTEAVRLLPPSRVLLLVCGGQEDYDRFREEARTAFTDRYGNAAKRALTAPALPDYPFLERPRRQGRPHPLRGVIRFGPGWTAQFVRFDPTTQRGLTPSSRWRATVRHQIEPLLAEVESQLPGEAVIPKKDYRLRVLAVLAAGAVCLPFSYGVVHSSRMLFGEKAVVLAMVGVQLLGGLYSMTVSAGTQRYFKVTVRLPDRRTTSWRGETGDPAHDAGTLARLVEERSRVLGTDHPETLDARRLLATFRGRAGDPAGAADAFAELLFEMLRALGHEHRLTVVTLGDLAQWRGMAGDPAGAANSLTQLLPRLVRVLGADHPHTLAFRSNLAMFRGMAGDPVGAADAYAEVLPDMLRVLGPDHPATVLTRNGLALWQGRAGGQGLTT
ncbi:tetratricopeptide repeat protein [Streptomyces sp. NPDC001034]|uniref:tetratricopeptide repeat protein n=1 Tax=Streptomyces sp. NPDC001034 TaxID=3154375 RepID=UPI003322D5B6